jgi:hypothetical protein
MGGHCSYQRTRWIIVLLGLGLVGCPESLEIGYATPGASAVPVVETLANAEEMDQVDAAVSYDICADLATWVRPEFAVQQQAVLQDPRYSQSLGQEPLSTLSEQFWTQPIITFTTYGLSARVEPMNLTGVWTATAQIEPCYGGDRPMAINQGDWAEVWIIGHRLAGIEWSNGQYLLTVEPTAKGLQVIQFERQETQSPLALVAVTTEGTAVPAISGDW